MAFFNFDLTKNISKQWYASCRMPVQELHVHFLASI